MSPHNNQEIDHLEEEVVVLLDPCSIHFEENQENQPTRSQPKQVNALEKLINTKLTKKLVNTTTIFTLK